MTRAILLLIGLLFGLAGTPAQAQNVNLNCWNPTGLGLTQWVPCNSTTPLQVAGTFSATLGGFAPNGNYATLTAAGTSGSVALPAGVVVLFSNTGTTTVSCTLGIGSATAVASEIQIPASSSVSLTVGSNTFGACIDQTGSTSNVVVLAGGAGLFTGFGGGGGGSGGAVTIASGGVASGAYASGSIASGAISNGADVVEGTITSAHTCATSGYTVIGCLGQIDDDVKATGNVNTAQVNGVTVLTGTGATGTGAQRVTVSTDQATNAGAALVKGGVGVVNGGSFYQTVAASQTATVLQSSTGAAGDYLSHCVLYPTSTSPGVVTVFDNANAAGTDVILFAGGASSLSNLAPIAVPVGAVSTAGAWKVTTGASISVACYGKFS